MNTGKIFKWAVADFETTVYDGQEFTEVWSAGLLEPEGKPEIYTSIDAFMQRVSYLENRTVVYFHNLKFDGSFIIPWLFNNGFNLGFDVKKQKMKKPSDLKRKEFTTHINRKGIWYNICVRFKNGILVQFFDSLKVIPFSLERAGKAFNTNHRKLEMEYKGIRHKNGYISEKERRYLENDLYVLLECMEHIFKEGITKRTIGSTCLAFFRRMYGHYEYVKDFPNVYEIESPTEFKSVGKYILRSYNGAFVYLKEEYKDKVVENGITIDATSLYASVMHSCSGYTYPIGKPNYRKGKAEYKHYKYFFQRIKCKFKLRDGYLPFIRIRGNPEFKAREIQKTSSYTHKGVFVDESVELVLTQEELKLFFTHYEVYYCEYIDYYEFIAVKGLFDEYIDYWLEKKETAENKVERTISKLFLTNLYGKFAAVPDSSFYTAFLEDDILHFNPVYEEDAIPGYIPIGAAIVSHARIFDVKACQANYEYFIYSDTDSLHLHCRLEDVRGVVIDAHKLCTFKCEAEWDKAIFNNVKRYIEHVFKEDGEPVKDCFGNPTGKYNITCAGMIEQGKTLLQLTLEEDLKEETLEKYNVKKITTEDLDYVLAGKKLEDFKQGLKVPHGKIVAKRMRGGTVLNEQEFTIL